MSQQNIVVSCQHLDVSGDMTINGTTTIYKDVSLDANNGDLIFNNKAFSSGGTGQSSILFRSGHNAGSDYGYIQYRDHSSDSAGENAQLIIGTQNDSTDNIILSPTGNVGIGTTSPSTKLYVNGTLGVSGTTTLQTLQATQIRVSATDHGLQNVTGNYGTVQTYGTGTGNWSGYSINGRWVFMGNNNDRAGIYNDVDNQWAIYFDRDEGVGGPSGYVPSGLIIQGYAVENDLGSGMWIDSNGIYSNPPATRYGIYCNYGVKGYRLVASSDDRIKKNEKYIFNAIETILKLKPQTYDKYNNFDCSGDYIFESGLIAQEIFYDAPELRHLVDIANDNNLNLSKHINTSEEPSIDPDYSSWGSSIAGVNYNGLIPYCIQAIKEQQEIIEEEKTKVSTLETQYNTLETQYNTLETQYNILQSQYNDLLSRISALENSS